MTSGTALTKYAKRITTRVRQGTDNAPHTHTTVSPPFSKGINPPSPLQEGLRFQKLSSPPRSSNRGDRAWEARHSPGRRPADFAAPASARYPPPGGGPEKGRGSEAGAGCLRRQDRTGQDRTGNQRLFTTVTSLLRLHHHHHHHHHHHRLCPALPWPCVT
jgi:hypothetical protein